MKKYLVTYEGGESRSTPELGVDYMIVDAIDSDGDMVVLYAEMENPTFDKEKDIDEQWKIYDELATFEDLEAEILEQAKEYGVDVESLDFSEPK